MEVIIMGVGTLFGLIGCAIGLGVDKARSNNAVAVAEAKKTGNKPVTQRQLYLECVCSSYRYAMPDGEWVYLKGAEYSMAGKGTLEQGCAIASREEVRRIMREEGMGDQINEVHLAGLGGMFGADRTICHVWG
jgi:hypothetical protein